MKWSLSFIVYLLFANISFGQNAYDSLSAIQVTNALKAYDDYTHLNAPVYNGPEYVPFNFTMTGTPFFTDKILSKGWISYEGHTYIPSYIFYDVNRQMVVIRDNRSASPIIIENERVDSFSIDDHVFIRLQRDHRQNLYNTGFYEVLYRSPSLQLLSMRHKDIELNMGGHTIIRNFYEKNKYFVYKNGLYYQVSDGKDVFSLFADKRNDLKRALRKEDMKFRKKNFELTLIRATELYDRL